MLKVGVRKLEEFRFRFEDEAKVGAFIGKIGLGDEATIQTARLRRAWTATRVYFSQVEQDRSEVVLADLDSLLEEVPLDIMFQYFYHAKRAASGLPANKRLAWLQARDSEERSEWVSKYRESTRSLGAVVKELMGSRDAHWIPHLVPDGHSNFAPPASSVAWCAPLFSCVAWGASLRLTGTPRSQVQGKGQALRGPRSRPGGTFSWGNG